MLLSCFFVLNFILRCRFIPFFHYPHRESSADGMSLSKHMQNALPWLLTIRLCFRLSNIKNQNIFKDPSPASVYFVKTLIDCLCTGPATEKELRNAVIEKCRISGVKATTRGTVSGKYNIYLSVDFHDNFFEFNPCFHYPLIFCVCFALSNSVMVNYYLVRNFFQ